MCSNLEDDSNFEGDDFDENYDRVDDLINDLKQSTEDPTEIERFDRLFGDAMKPVYPGSSFTCLSATLKLYSLKAKNGWSDKSFTSLLELLGKILPDGNELPRRTYDAKKILCPMGVDYVKIHACRNDCSILFRKDYKDLDKCPKQPGNDIDVYLEPLIDDLKLLWDEGVEVLKRARFVCEEDTIYDRLVHGGKNVYLCNRRLLRRSHPYRKKMKPFNGKQELRNPPKILSGKEVYEKVKNIENNFGKPYKRTNNGTLYKKKSIFWDLPYWKHLSVRHCIDVMHVEKNVCDSIIGTLLNITGKTKDGLKARQDMVAQKIRPELAPQVRGSRTYLPPACFTLSRTEKRSVVNVYMG
ncbi:uncharacterized protein LOC141649251 [Silene latifolia]|uniref:uncharacterized protein LOC141649251 n=1 Tax=Silene latifolia TaxID=37657 RepID=UPI003D785F82